MMRIGDSQTQTWLNSARPPEEKEGLITQVRDFWDLRPCNVRHSAKPVGTREYFDEVEARKYFVEPRIPGFAEFPFWSGKRVLEIGCGIGTDTINFARHGAWVTAVELSEKSLDLARKRVEVYGFQNQVRSYLCNAEELRRSVPVEPYDLIYSFGTIHHSPHPERIIEQIRFYTHPGSIVKVMLYHRCSWKVLEILFRYGKWRFWRLEELIARFSEAQENCPVTYAYTKREAREMFGRVGFHIKEIFVDHIFPYRIADYLSYRYVKVWYFRWMPRSFFRWIEEHFGWHLYITAEA